MKDQSDLIEKIKQSDLPLEDKQLLIELLNEKVIDWTLVLTLVARMLEVAESVIEFFSSD